jgi:redox-sensitive bicupin YhaK (pirin superfamily)
MKTKSVQQILTPPSPHMVGNGFRVHNFFPNGYALALNRMSPFFLLDYNAKIEFSPTNIPRGVGVHPHRGFETVTIAYHGRVAHHDSKGNSGVISEGDVQWMTAASGVLHKEYHEMEFSKTGGLFQMVQLWINLPAKYKMSEPKYQPVTQSQMGKYNLPWKAGTVEVIAGEFNGVKGPASTFSPIHMYNMRIKKDASFTFTLPENFNTGILVIEGSVKVNESMSAPADNFVLFNNDGKNISILAEENSILLVLSGEPINEPITAYGPFLMNTKEEIIQAYEDFNNGKFGELGE